ncbi:MAG: biopolymer transporter ExbD [Chitinivibrionia bacterium]|nr:biopolymer transporter ExbD [Chitinivibrionia bacterium]
MSFQRTVQIENRIPTASMADIAFLLLIFFMSTTIFKMEEGLPVELPRAAAAQSQKQERILHVWIDAGGDVSINDKLVSAADLGDIMKAALSVNPALVIAFNADYRTAYGTVAAVIEELKKANAVRVSFTCDPEADSGPK